MARPDPVGRYTGPGVPDRRPRGTGVRDAMTWCVTAVLCAGLDVAIMAGIVWLSIWLVGYE